VIGTNPVVTGSGALAVDGWKDGKSFMASDKETAPCNWLQARFCRSTVAIKSCITAAFGETVQNLSLSFILLRPWEALFEHDRELAFDGVPFAPDPKSRRRSAVRS